MLEWSTALTTSQVGADDPFTASTVSPAIPGFADGRHDSSQHEDTTDRVVLCGLPGRQRPAWHLGALAPTAVGAEPVRDRVDAAAQTAARDGERGSRPRARAGQVSQTSSLSSRSSRLRSPVRALPASTPVQPLSLDEEERQIRARELEVRRQRLESEEAAAMHQTLQALQAEIARADARAEADQQRQREAELAERAYREAQAEVDRRVRIGNHVCSLTAIAHWRDRLPFAIEDTAKARVQEALKDAPAGARKRTRENRRCDARRYIPHVAAIPGAHRCAS